MQKGYMYILKCSDGSYYTGSTINLEMRLAQHQWGEGANHTKTRLPVTLVYFEEYHRIDEAFSREKQVQGWSRKKKEALIQSKSEELHELAKCMNETSHRNKQGGLDSLRLRSGQAAQPPGKNTGGFDSAQSPKNASGGSDSGDFGSAQLPGSDSAQPPARDSALPPEKEASAD